MYHYTYLLTFLDGMKYVGVRSTTILPELDTCYLGSGKALPERTLQTCTKTILGVFPTRNAAVNSEIEFIRLNNCVKSKEYYNLRAKTFDKHGIPASLAEKARLTAMSREISRIEYGLKYSGEGRTPAQRAGDLRAAEKIKGTKCPAKGQAGSKNPGFAPWYFISPDGTYTEVFDTAKQDYAHKLGVTPRQLGHRFHHSNEHKIAKTKPLKGWIFGNLPRPDVAKD